jgi:methylated-DNA-[protein]-cysteine S-methyltransferase
LIGSRTVFQSVREQETGSEGCPFFVSDLGRIAGTSSTGEPESATVATPFGGLAFSARDGRLTGIEFLLQPTPENVPANSVLEEAARQFSAYFQDPAFRFSLPLGLVGTDYTRRVWQALVEIPGGQTRSYGSLARVLDSGPRAVAAACRANAFPIVIPCHRVVAAHGLGGFCGRMSGPFLDIKRWLLKHEGCTVD